MLSIILVKDLPRLSLTANSKATSVAKQQRFFQKSTKAPINGPVTAKQSERQPSKCPCIGLHNFRAMVFMTSELNTQKRICYPSPVIFECRGMAK